MELAVSFLKVVAGAPCESFTYYANEKDIDTEIQTALLIFKNKLSYRYGIATRETRTKLIFWSGDNANFVELSVPLSRVSARVVKDYLNGHITILKGEAPPLR